MNQKEIPLTAVGRLEGIGVPELLRDVCRRGLTGTLHLRRDPIDRSLFIAAGRITFARSNDPNDWLGETLLRQAKVTLAQLEEALAMQGSGKRLGTLMVECGILAADDLVTAVAGQIKAVTFDLLSWTHGEYRFEEGPVPEEDIRLELSTDELLLEGVRGIRSCAMVDRGVGPSHTTYRLSKDWAKQVDRLRLTDAAQLLIERLAEGSENVDGLCRVVCLSSFEVCQTLWALKLIGIVETCRSPVLDENGMLSEGRLEETTLGEILAQLERERETGILYLHHGSVERRFLFGAGRCLFATSNDPDDGLVSCLFQRGIISLDDKEKMSERLLSNRRVGTILREIGAIDDADLQNMVRLQLSEIIHSTFLWERGDFKFVRGSLPVAENVTLTSSASTLVAEGIRRINSWTRLVYGCGGIDNALCLTPDHMQVLDAMEAGVAEWEVVSAMRSPQTPRRICRSSEIPDFRVCQILWTLKLLGAVENSPIDMEACEAPASQPEQALVEADESDEADGEQVETSDAPEVEVQFESVGDDVPGEIDVQIHLDMDPGEHVEEDAVVWDPPADLEPIIQRFNAMHRIVFRAVRAEIGAGAVNFVRSCCDGMFDEDPDPVAGVELYVDGSWNAEELKTVIVDQRIEEPWPAYQAVLDREFVTLLPLLGEMAAAELKRKIWEVQQEQGTA